MWEIVTWEVTMCLSNKQDSPHKFCHSQGAKGQKVIGVGGGGGVGCWLFFVWQLEGLQGACGARAFHHYPISNQTNVLNANSTQLVQVWLQGQMLSERIREDPCDLARWASAVSPGVHLNTVAVVICRLGGVKDRLIMALARQFRCWWNMVNIAQSGGSCPLAVKGLSQIWWRGRRGQGMETQSKLNSHAEREGGKGSTVKTLAQLSMVSDLFALDCEKRQILVYEGGVGGAGWRLLSHLCTADQSHSEMHVSIRNTQMPDSEPPNPPQLWFQEGVCVSMFVCPGAYWRAAPVEWLKTLNKHTDAVL